MKTHKKIEISFSRESGSYEIEIGRSLAESGRFARRVLGRSCAKIAIVSNPTVYSLYGGIVEQSLTDAGFAVSHWLMKDGEKHKNFRSVEQALAHFAESGVTRTDAVVALGGGVVGDLAGFAASIYLRGIRFLQLPTTLLAMVDSSVGGKTGVNSEFGKNVIGTFHQPRGVLVDPAVLATLPTRELTAGFCEVVKHGVLSGRKLFDRTGEILNKDPNLRFEISNLRSEIIDLIGRNIEFKAKIVAGDERESSKRTDSRSRKILNFGHTLAHALEKVTDYTYFKHGEAVGYGMLYAAELSKSLALVDKNVVKSLYDVVHRVGPLPSLAHIDPQEVFEAFRFDKKQLAGSLQMVLLKGIGKPVIVDGESIPKAAHSQAFKQLLKF